MRIIERNNEIRNLWVCLNADINEKDTWAQASTMTAHAKPAILHGMNWCRMSEVDKIQALTSLAVYCFSEE